MTYDWRIVAAIDDEIQRTAVEHDESPVGSPWRKHCALRVAEFQRLMDRYIAQHSQAGLAG